MSKLWISRKELNNLVKDSGIYIVSIGVKNEVKWRKKGFKKTYVYQTNFPSQSLYAISNAIITEAKRI
ncbi:hypothetical protein EGM181_18325 (plasmid) [Enterococcus gallinarum]|uniref:Uncharacterized protein n=1 Tax=Enterococcus gallinarum TaxID=1353 RepID=A0AAE7T1Q3_ENTGA|nr:hypothetical protein [Enterococcus gallinarum]EKZ0236319.1 hypothetical protein [Enterococcus faecalis]QOG29270.1 hypothetical protein EGM181_18325 [Enterococcus gallinarum]